MKKDKNKIENIGFSGHMLSKEDEKEINKQAEVIAEHLANMIGFGICGFLPTHKETSINIKPRCFKVACDLLGNDNDGNSN